MRRRSSARPAARPPPPGFGKFFPRDAPPSRKAPSKENGKGSAKEAGEASKEAGEAGEASKEAGEAGEAGKEAGEGQRGGGPKEGASKTDPESSFADEAKEAWRGLFGGAGKPGAQGGKPGAPKGGGPKGGPKGGPGGQSPTPRMEDIIAAAALVLLTGFFLPMGGDSATVREISWQEFKTNLLQAGEVRGGAGGGHGWAGSLTRALPASRRWSAL